MTAPRTPPRVSRWHLARLLLIASCACVAVYQGDPWLIGCCVLLFCEAANDIRKATR